MSASAPADSFGLSSSKGFFVYILKCSDGSLYVGHASNVDERVKTHNEGRGASWTACRRPVTLVYYESASSVEKAVARERQIKRWTHDKKLALIAGDLGKLKALAKRRVRCQ
jgi:predicted GIY-YIG superfamily endonuclease